MIVLAILGVPTVMVLASIFNGYALSVLWRWFVVPVFGLPELGIVSAIGISMVVHFLTYQDMPEDKSKSFGEKLTMKCMIAFIHPASALLFGAIAKEFM